MNKHLSTVFAAAAAAALFISSAGMVSAAPSAHQPKGGAPADAHILAAGVSGWAVINSDGTIARKLNAVSAQQLSVGQYEVIFNSKINKCNYTVSTGDPGSSAVPGAYFIGVTGRQDNAKGVFVATYDNTGNPIATPFFVNVTC